MTWTLAFSGLIALCCSGTNGPGTVNDSSRQHCGWPSDLNNDGGGRTTCQPARALVSCTNSAGGGCGCLSNDGLSCDGCGAPRATCQDQCGGNEYAVACGGIGPGPVPSPPDGCTSAGAIPGGVAFYCCPCN